ncbi:Uncharacterised protein [Mycobacteroides abscessus subsp. abscessus]|nr:Uncharacterised protein [Mycobacteroides abscessus subsp. abscessus]
MGCPQHLEHLVESLLTDDVSDADILELCRGNLDCHITIGNLQNEVFDLLTFDGPGNDVFDPGSTVMGVDNGVANFEIQCSVPLSSRPSLARGSFGSHPTVQVKALLRGRRPSSFTVAAGERVRP